MPRTRTMPVHESLTALRRLEKRTNGRSLRARITMLRMLKEDASRTLREVATELGVSYHTVKLWWQWYMDEGLVRLRQERKKHGTVGSERGISGLYSALGSGKIRTLEQVRAWVNAEDEAQPRARRGKPTTESSQLLFSPDALSFLNSFPHTLDHRGIVEALRVGIIRHFFDVDRASISVDLHCDLISPQTYRPNLRTLQHARYEEVATTVVESSLTPDQDLLDHFRKANFPFDDYHPPVSWVYHYNTAYIGTIILWRERGSPPISQQTLDTFERLRPFFVFLLSDLVARSHMGHPASSIYMKALDTVAKEFGLLRREHQVLVLHSTGLPPVQIADTLNLAESTVRTYIRRIYEKLGVHSVSELFARHLTPKS